MFQKLLQLLVDSGVLFPFRGRMVQVEDLVDGWVLLSDAAGNPVDSFHNIVDTRSLLRAAHRAGAIMGLEAVQALNDEAEQRAIAQADMAELFDEGGRDYEAPYRQAAPSGFAEESLPFITVPR